MKNITTLFTFLLLICFLPSLAQVYVRGYTKSNGTYVQPHYRSSPNSSLTDNYSYPGNVNPYTGKVATGSVDAYIRNHSNTSNGTISGSDPSPQYLIQQAEENMKRSLGQSNYSNSNTRWSDNSSISGFNFPATPVIKTNSVISETLIRKGPGKKFAVLYQVMFPEEIEILDSYQNGWSKISFNYLTRSFDYVKRVGYVHTSRITSSTW